MHDEQNEKKNISTRNDGNYWKLQKKTKQTIIDFKAKNVKLA